MKINSYFREARYERLFQKAPVGIAIVTPEGQVVEANPAVCELFGYSAQEMQALNVGELYVDRRQRKEFRRVLETKGVVENFEVQLQHKSGKELTCLLTSTAERGTNGSVVSYQTIIYDITYQRHLQREVLHIAEEQQKQIGRDLHDSIAGLLTGLAMVMEGFIRMVKNGEHVALEDLQRVSKAVREGAKEVRALSHGMSLLTVEEEGLEVALKELAHNYESLHRISCSYQGDPNIPPLGSQLKTHLYRIAQEAVTNARDHGKAKSIDAYLRWTEHELILTIEDDGHGISEKVETVKGMGLKTMEYRAALIGGTLHVEPRQRGGTRVECRVPRARIGSTEK